MIWKFAAAAALRRQPSHLIPRASAAPSFTVAGATATATAKRPPLRFNMVLFTSNDFRQCLVSVSEMARGFSASAHVHPPYSYGGFSFPGSPGICTVAGSSSTTSYVVGGLAPALPDCRSNLLFSLDSADLMPPPAPTAYDHRTTIIPSPWKKLASLETPSRVNPAVLSHDGKLFIFGGCDTNKSWLEIVDTVSGRVIESRDLPDHLPEEAMEPMACFYWDGLFMVQCDDDSIYDHRICRLYSYSLEDDHWELFDDNFPPLMLGYQKRNVLPVGKNGDKVFILDKSDLWMVYDLSSRQKVEEVRVEGMPIMRHVEQAFISSSEEDDESWIIRMFIRGDSAWLKRITYEDFGYAYNMPYARVRVGRQGENFVAKVESFTEIAVDPYEIGAMIFPLQKLPAEVEVEE